ncbi:NUDIX domain-containing protein [Phytomonospora endophytica]|uniref:8-oxo-dGTP pyrophosphatase MutT (NUDIX family) n=1 Tax=Phytomonospora endophytica TaxID=714109 RepID=A0A841FP75_9ACTN|nr:NUDIX domain-containing protein [Phytomonospora endophytica]MBB6037905.1 8-oxo-dGTP pyrophosphatase MutT (NUDIX family) [Phytomonospora endophytica]GIG68805.1 ADP-ribose pyrophosphatase [Phytomonospora endophytica]
MATIENSAKAMIIHDDQILLVEYIDNEFGLGMWYSLPGGRQVFGDELTSSLARECMEEVGAEITVGPLRVIREYVHSNHELRDVGRDQHKVEFMFLCGLASEIRSVSQATADAGQVAARWVHLDELSKLNIFPRKLKDLRRLLDEGREIYWGDTY